MELRSTTWRSDTIHHYFLPRFINTLLPERKSHRIGQREHNSKWFWAEKYSEQGRKENGVDTTIETDKGREKEGVDGGIKQRSSGDEWQEVNELL